MITPIFLTMNHCFPKPESLLGWFLRLTRTFGILGVVLMVVSQSMAQAPTFTSAATYNFTLNSFGYFPITASGVTSFTQGAGSSLPPGVTFEVNSAILFGTPTDATGSPYTLYIDATNSSGTTRQTFTVTVTPANLVPVFSSNPSSTSVQAGTGTSFSAAASSSPSPTYRWQRQPFGSATFVDLSDSIVYSGSASGTLTLASTVPSMNGDQFRLVATNGSYVTASTPAVLIVNSIVPSIITNPSDLSVNNGLPATFTASATGLPIPTLRWQRQPFGTFGYVNLSDDTVFSGTTTGTLSISAVTAGMTGDSFRLFASNEVGTITTTAAILTVNIGSVISTFAGVPGLPGVLDGTSQGAGFNSPAAIAVDSAGTFYIADKGNSLIRKMSASGVVTTIAGLAGARGAVDGTGTASRFNAPGGIAVDTLGNIYVADTLNHTIRMVSPLGAVTTLAGTAGSSGSSDGIGAAARFSQPSGVAVDALGNVYVADTGNNTIRRVSSAGNVITIAGGAGLAGYVNDAVPTLARFNSPSSVAVDPVGNVYVADSLNNAIRRVGAFGVVTTFAGSAVGTPGFANGTGVAAGFNRPGGISIDSSGNLFVADTGNHLIRKIVSSSDVTTIAGIALTSGSTDGASNIARFNNPGSVVSDSLGNLFIVDTANSTIRRTGGSLPVQILAQPQARSATLGQDVTYSILAIGTPSPSSYQWQRQAAGLSGFVNIGAGTDYSGVNSSSLTVRAVTSAMNGDQYRVVVANGIGSPTVSATALLSSGALPVITSAATTSFRAGEANSFTVVASSPVAVAFSATSLPSWAALDAATGVLSGNPPDTTGSPFVITLKANSGLEATQSFTLSILPANIPPSIVSQPVAASVNPGQSATFSVVAGGTAPFTYQWRRNGVTLGGATASSLSLSGVQVSAAGVYTAVVTNAFGNVTTSGAVLTVNAVPSISIQPGPQITLAGGSATFSAAASGAPSFQWRKNGVNIPGATSATLTLVNVSVADAANYDVVLSNAAGSTNSSSAQLSVSSVTAAPVITAQPRGSSALAGSSVALSVSATGVPAPTFQWRRNGAAVAGATGGVLSLASAQVADAGNYDVLISNSVGSVTTQAAALRVFPKSFAGVYFGSFSGGFGSFALYVRDDNSGVLLSYLPGLNIPVSSTGVVVGDAGQFSVAQVASGSVGALNLNGSILADGTLSGTLSGAVSATLSGSQSSDIGTSQSVAGFYQGGALLGAGVINAIVSGNGQAFVAVQSGVASDGGVGSASASGQITVSTNRSLITGLVNPSTGLFTAASTGAVSANYAGGTGTAVSLQRLGNISSRARVASGDSVAIVGFVISGQQSKPVLIRAVGPTLGAAPFNVSGALTTPSIELFRGATSVATNAGIGTNRAAIDAAAQLAGAFGLGVAGTDAAILTTLAPGNYTAVVSSSTAAAGVALVEVYDLSGVTAGQKLLNISTRASAGTGDNLLIAGFVVPPGTTKRVLVRGVGPGLAAFGVTGVLAQPTLTLFSGSTSVATNTNWSSSADATTITAASASVGAFGLSSNDSALVVTLAPGNYTAQVTGPGTATGVALIEVYELP
jgi:sugar lactone lactonase YvrE